jgi:hypothetical protein
MRAAVVLAIALAGLAMASPDSRNRVARALLEARSQPAGDRQMWPELLGPERPEIIELDPGPNAPRPKWPEALPDPDVAGGLDPEVIAAKNAAMDAEIAALRKAHNPRPKRKPGGLR